MKRSKAKMNAAKKAGRTPPKTWGHKLSVKTGLNARWGFNNVTMAMAELNQMHAWLSVRLEPDQWAVEEMLDFLMDDDDTAFEFRLRC